MPDRTALYPGSFDPPTNGHLDLIMRASRLFDRLVVAVARNSEKSAFFSVEERVEMLNAITAGMPRVEVTSFKGLTADFARQIDAVALVRGLRVVSDFEFELTMAIHNRKLNADVDTVCLMPSEPYLFLSSGIAREIVRHGGDLSDCLPPEVITYLKRKFAASP